MALTVKQLVNRHGAFVSAVTALLVGAAMVVTQLLLYVIGLIATGQVYGFPILQVLIGAAPFALGYFISLWIIAPIAEELRIPHVVTRAILATGVASTVYFIVLAVVGVVNAFGINGSLYSQSLATILGFSGASALNALGGALTGALSVFVTSLPLGILAGVLLWLWRKDHPPKRPLSGLIDEV